MRHARFDSHRAVFTRPDALVSAVVAIPANNEEDEIGDCLASLGRQSDSRDVGVVVFANNCTDGTFARAEDACRRHDLSAFLIDGVLKAAHAGIARRIALDHACAWLESQPVSNGLLLTTDADSEPAHDWVARNRASIAAGADLVAGRIELDPVDAASLPRALQERGRLEEIYENQLTEVFSRLDPIPHDPWPRHAQEGGASLAVRLSAYRSVGGLPEIPSGEDRALVSAIERGGYRVRHDPSVVVKTSGRLIGRAHGGVADTIRLRCDHPDAPCDPYLEPAVTAWRRGRIRSLLRRSNMDPDILRWIAAWADLSRDDQRRFRCNRSFVARWSLLEKRALKLQRSLLSPSRLPQQIIIAGRMLRNLRRSAPVPASIGLAAE